MANPVAYVLCCAAPPASDVGRLVKELRARDWTVGVFITPSARAFVDEAALAKISGRPVRSDYGPATNDGPLPPPSIMIVAPASFNTINKWALGIADTLVSGLLAESLGKEIPVVAVPWVNLALNQHPALPRSISMLRGLGASILYGPEVQLPAPGSGPTSATMFPWDRTLEMVDWILNERMLRDESNRFEEQG